MGKFTQILGGQFGYVSKLMRYTEISFTITKASIVEVYHEYYYARPLTVGISSSPTIAGAYGFTNNNPPDTNAASICISHPLKAGTYYIWASAETDSNTNTFYVSAYQI